MIINFIIYLSTVPDEAVAEGALEEFSAGCLVNCFGGVKIESS